MTDPRDRAEEAFRDAFAGRADVDPAPLDPDALRRLTPGGAQRPGRPRLLGWAVAAAVMVVAVPVGVQLLDRGGSPTASSGAPAFAPAPEAADRAGAADTDHNGCPAAAPAAQRPPAGAPVLGPDAVADGAVLCQYDDLTRTEANLAGSRALDAAAATGLLRAMAAGGPVGRSPGTCVQDDRSATLVVLHQAGTGRQVWLRVPGCDPSTVDDGVLTVAATTEVCAAVFVPPLGLPDAAAAAGDACRAE